MREANSSRDIRQSERHFCSEMYEDWIHRWI